MNFNYGLAKEIYGGTPWCMDHISFMSMSNILRNAQNGVQLDVPDVKLNGVSFLNTKNEIKFVSEEWHLDTGNDFEGIGIVNLNGPITKGGGMSSIGMIELSDSMKTFARDSRVKGFIVLTDSGGGASGAVEIMSDTINEVKKSKPVYSLITKGGMAASAAYGIISASTKIFSENEMNIVGSIGTMISFDGYKANSQDSDGLKHVVLYASKSTMKNKAFNEALNNDNYDLLINELLDPINDNFISKTLANRPQLEGTKFDNGHTVFSKDAVGTFIDGIASFDEVVQMILSDGKEENNSNININSNSKKMNKQELKQNHPELYSEILTEGVSNEQDRVASWEAYREADSKSVSEGIQGGLAITNAQAHRFQVMLATKGKVLDLKSDSAPAVDTPESKTVITSAATDLEEELNSAFDFKL